MKLKHTILACCMPAFSACDNDENVPVVTLEGTLRWTGDIATDGCGFILTVNDNSTKYKPAHDTNIPSAYQTGEPINVIVKAQLYNETTRPCWSSTEFHKIEVLSVKRK